MDKQPTIVEIAKMAGVSPATVSRILNKTRREVWAGKQEQAERIRAIAERVGYRPNPAARAMRGVRSRQIAALVQGIAPGDWQFDLIMGIVDAASRLGFSLSIIGRIDELTADDPALHNALFDGVIGVGLRIDDAHPVAKALPSRRVWLEPVVPLASDCVSRDELAAGKMAAAHMIARGYRRIVFLGLDRWEGCHYSVIDREKGAADEAAACGVEFISFQLQVAVRTLAQKRGEVLKHLASETAVVAWSTALAEWCSHLAAEEGLRVGFDFGLACCEETRSTALAWPGLSRISFDRAAMGACAVELLFQRREKPSSSVNSRVFSGEWIEGATAGRSHRV